MTEYGAYFAADASTHLDEVTSLTGRSPMSWGGSSRRSTPGLFDADIVAKPCKWPCPYPDHVHAEDLPTNRVARANHPADERPYLSSDHSEVRD